MTTDELLNELKNRGEVSFTPKKKEFYIVDDCWTMIKEFAGIWDYGIDWSKLERLGVDKVHDLFKNNCNKRLTNFKKNPAEAKRMIYKQLFTNYKTLENMKALALLTNPPKIIDELPDVSVGDEVMYWKNGNRLGVVVKINKTSISWKEYEDSGRTTSDNPDAFKLQTFETKTHYYDKTKFKKAKAIKHYRKPYEDELLGYEVRHDWGR